MKITPPATWAALAAATLVVPGAVPLHAAPRPPVTLAAVAGTPVATSGLGRVVHAAPVRSRAARSPYDRLIERHAERHGVRTDLVRAIIKVESNFDPRAVSPKGALGLMQLMPGTAAAFRVSDAFDPEQNIRGGVAYLSRLLDRYDNDEALALAAYNAGPTAVARYGNRVPPYRETRNYIRKVRAASETGSPLPAGHAIYKVDTASGSPRYTNVRPVSARFSVVRGTR